MNDLLAVYILKCVAYLADDLLAPDWSRKKVAVINDIDKLLYERGTYQGWRAE